MGQSSLLTLVMHKQVPSYRRRISQSFSSVAITLPLVMRPMLMNGAASVMPAAAI